MLRYPIVALVALAPLFVDLPSNAGDKDTPGLKVDKDKRTLAIDAKIAPRKLEHLKGEIYPIEVIACWAHPKGKKAHETIVTFDVNPSQVHKGLEMIGLKPGAPVMGESKEPPQGPDVNIFLEFPSPDGEIKRLSIDRALVDSRTGKAFPKSVKWRFTGSVLSQPDPTKKELVYGADLSGTLGVIFPVSNQTVFQTSLTMREEKFMKLEPSKLLPPEGTAVKLVIEVPK